MSARATVRLTAVSLWEPWASLMAVGAKTIETRHWPTRHRGPLVIHAAKRWTGEEADFLSAAAVQRALAPLKTDGASPVGQQHLSFGCIVAIVNMTACVSTSGVFAPEMVPELKTIVDREIAFGNYEPNRFLWITSDVHRLCEPIPVRGHQALFDVEVPESEYRAFIAGIGSGSR